MADIEQTRKQLLERVVDGEGRASNALRQAAFNNHGLDEPLRSVIGKVASRAIEVTDEDVSSLVAFGLSEDQVFEIVVSAALGEASRQYESALAALDAASTGSNDASRNSR